MLERFHDTSGVIGKKDVWRYRVRTTVKNRRPEAVKLALLDLVPVPRDAEIEVKVLDGTTAATREDPERPGVRTWEWELTLAAREAKVVELLKRGPLTAQRGAGGAGVALRTPRGDGSSGPSRTCGAVRAASAGGSRRC